MISDHKHHLLFYKKIACACCMYHILKFMNMDEADLCGHNFVQLTPVCIPVYSFVQSRAHCTKKQIQYGRFQRACSTKSGDMIGDWWQQILYLLFLWDQLLTIHFSKVISTIEPHFCILANIVIFLNTGNVY